MSLPSFIKSAVITGASTGIGECFARELAKEKVDLFLAARSGDKLKELSEELSQAHGIRAEYFAVDLAEPGSPRALFDETVRREFPVTLLVNNAGFGSYGEFRLLDLNRETQMIRLNVIAMVEATHLFLLPMLEQGSGAIVNVASVAGYQPFPHMATYGATKAFMLNFTEAVAAETRGSGVRVMVLCPGATRTDFIEIAGVGNVVDHAPVESVDAVVRSALRGLERGSRTVISGWRNRALITLERFLPRRFVLWLMETVMRKRGEN